MKAEPPTLSAHHRVIAYVDGFNLYFGLREAYRRKYLWLDVPGLVRLLLKPGQQLILTHYFTARISGPTPSDHPQRAHSLEGKRRRQGIYLEAMASALDCRVHLGHFLEKPMQCRKCGSTWRLQEEKMTDVNIATEMMVNAFNDQFDTAILVSGDSDLAPPVLAIREHFPEKRVVVVFPPSRFSAQLARSATAYLSIRESALKASQFPSTIAKQDGFILHRPTEWS